MERHAVLGLATDYGVHTRPDFGSAVIHLPAAVTRFFFFRSFVHLLQFTPYYRSYSRRQTDSPRRVAHGLMWLAFIDVSLLHSLICCVIYRASSFILLLEQSACVQRWLPASRRLISICASMNALTSGGNSSSTSEILPAVAPAAILIQVPS